jgi:hypothetical protein
LFLALTRILDLTSAEQHDLNGFMLNPYWKMSEGGDIDPTRLDPASDCGIWADAHDSLGLRQIVLNHKDCFGEQQRNKLASE